MDAVSGSKVASVLALMAFMIAMLVLSVHINFAGLAI